MKQYLALVFFLFFFILCNKLPIGEEELGERGVFDAQEIELIRYITLTEYDKFPQHGSSQNLIVGKNGDYESRTLLRFDFPDTSFQGLDEIKLVLRRNTEFYRDTINYSIHLLKQEFEEGKANWYQRTEEQGWEAGGGDFDEDSLRSGQVVEDSLVVKFNYIELEQIQASEGMIIIAQDSGFVYFSSREGSNPPQFLLKKNDVVTSIPIEADCHIVTGPEPFYIESWLGSGVPYRNYAKFLFDSLLIDEKPIYAELTFEVEDYFAMRDSIQIGVKELIEPLEGFDTSTGSFIALKKFAADNTLFSLDIVRHIQRMVEHPDSNFGFFIILSPENYDIASFKIVHGSHRLHVGYIAPPQDR